MEVIIMVQNYYLTEKLSQYRQTELREEARLARMVANARKDNPGSLPRFLTWSGGLLISIGQGLQAMFEAENKPRPTLTHSG
jgi:hypothetical protein